MTDIAIENEQIHTETKQMKTGNNNRNTMQVF